MELTKINGNDKLTVTNNTTDYLFDKNVFMEYIESTFNMNKRYAIDLTDAVLEIASLMTDKEKAKGFLFYCLPLEKDEIDELMEEKK